MSEKHETALEFELLQIEEKGAQMARKWWNYVRWLSTVSFLSVGILQMAMNNMELPKDAFLLTLTGIVLLNIVYSFFLGSYTKQQLYHVFYNLMDVAMFSLAIFMTGGMKSPLIWSYLIPILTSSINIGHRAGLTASIASVIGLFMVMLMDSSVVVFGMSTFGESAKHIFQNNTHTLLSYACLFFLAYFISSFLANTLRLQNGMLSKMNYLLNKKNRQLIESQEKLVQMERRATIDKMARTIQNELNDPLTIVSMNVEMLSKSQAAVKPERIHAIAESIQRIQKVLAKIEDLYKSSSTTKSRSKDIKIVDVYQTKINNDLPMDADPYSKN